MSPRRATLDLALFCAGFLIWSSAFLALYGVQGLGCSAGWDDVRFGSVTLLRPLLIAIWVAHLAALLALVWWTRRRMHDGATFLRRAGYVMSCVAGLATIWMGAPILGLTMCN